MIEKITGCILLGGKSLRMGGGFKSLKCFNNKSILERVIERSEKQVSTLAINSNTNIKELEKYYLPIFPDSIYGFLGPLAGIHASIKWTKINNPKHKWVFTFAGDTPFFPYKMVEKMYNKATKENKKIILANSFERNHPVFGLWHTSLEEDIYNSIVNKNIRKIIHWAENHLFKIVNFENKKYDPFFNINTPKDLSKAEEIENQFIEKK